MDVLRGVAVLVGGAVAAVAGEGRGGLDDLDFEARAEGLHVADDELAVGLDVVGREDFGELSESKSCEDAHDIRVVGLGDGQ